MAVAVAVLLVTAWVVPERPARAMECPPTSWSAPVNGPVVDAFRPPEHIGAPGNRGWEFDLLPRSPVHAAADGVVGFAGMIGRQRYVALTHCDGTRTTYSFLGEIDVTRGAVVVGGQRIGAAGPGFHFGVVRAGSYVDPALLLGVGPPQVRLVPVEYSWVLAANRRLRGSGL